MKYILNLIILVCLYSKQIDTIKTKHYSGSSLNQVIINNTLSLPDNRNDKFFYRGIKSDNLLITINGIDPRTRFKPYNFQDYFQKIDIQLPSINPDILDILIIDEQQSSTEHIHGALAGFHFKTKRNFEKLNSKLSFSTDRYGKSLFVNNGTNYNNIKAYVSGPVSNGLPINFLASINYRNQASIIAETYSELDHENRGYNFYGFLNYTGFLNISTDYLNVSNTARPYDHTRSYFSENRYKARYNYDQNLVKVKLKKEISDELSISVSYQYNQIKMESGDDTYWKNFIEYGRKSNFEPPKNAGGNVIINDELKAYGNVSLDGNIAQAPGTYYSQSASNSDFVIDLNRSILAVNTINNFYQKSREETNTFDLLLSHSSFLDVDLGINYRQHKLRKWGFSPVAYITNLNNQDEFFKNSSYSNYYGYNYKGEVINDENANYTNGSINSSLPGKKGSVAPYTPSETSLKLRIKKTYGISSFDLGFNYQFINGHHHIKDGLLYLLSNKWNVVEKKDFSLKYFLPKLSSELHYANNKILAFYNRSLIIPDRFQTYRGPYLSQGPIDIKNSDKYGTLNLPTVITQYGLQLSHRYYGLTAYTAITQSFTTINQYDRNIFLKKKQLEVTDNINSNTFRQILLAFNYSYESFNIGSRTIYTNEYTPEYSFQFLFKFNYYNLFDEGANISFSMKKYQNTLGYKPQAIFNTLDEISIRNRNNSNLIYLKTQDILLANLKIEKNIKLALVNFKLYFALNNIFNETVDYKIQPATAKSYTDGYLESHTSWQDLKTNTEYKRKAYEYAIKNPYNRSEPRTFELGISLEL